MKQLTSFRTARTFSTCAERSTTTAQTTFHQSPRATEETLKSDYSHFFIAASPVCVPHHSVILTHSLPLWNREHSGRVHKLLFIAVTADSIMPFFHTSDIYTESRTEVEVSKTLARGKFCALRTTVATPTFLILLRLSACLGVAHNSKQTSFVTRTANHPQSGPTIPYFRKIGPRV